MKAIHAYLIFNGNCREAMTFYQKCLGADLQMMTFAEAKVDTPEKEGGRIIHASLGSKGALLMASDNMPGMTFTQGDNYNVSIACESMSEIEKYYKGLGEGATITMPLAKTFWAERFAMLTDKFGVNWMLNFEKEA